MAIRRFQAELKVGALMLISVLILSAIGYWAYERFHAITAVLSDETRPDRKLVLLKDIMSDLSYAESGVRAYSLTDDKQYLEPYYYSLASMETKVDELRMLADTQSIAELIIIDTLSQLIDRKFEVLNDMLVNRDENRMGKTLDVISEKLQDEGVKKRRRQEELQEEIDRLKTREANVRQALRERELELVRRDKEIMSNIRTLITDLETRELLALDRMTEDVTQEAAETNRWIAIFSSGLAILLLFSIYNLLQFARRNRAYQTALLESKREAEDLANAKQRFVANVSHEIRTPMNAIVGFTEQLLDSDLQHDQKRQVEIIGRSADHLQQIVNDILDFSKLESGKLQLVSVAFKPAGVFREVSDLMSPMCREKGLALNCLISPDVPASLKGDPHRLRQILINLLSNAIKFTADGKVEMSLKAEAIDEGTYKLLAAVTDTGTGISEDELESIFDDFTQVEKHVHKPSEGTGLGLTICRKLVQMQEGEINVTSTLGEGTTVSFSIPYEIAETVVEDKKRTGPVLLPEELKNLKVLVGEDEEYNRQLIAAILKKLGLDFTIAADGVLVMEELENRKFDLILIDIKMPRMDGLEVIENIRQFKPDREFNSPDLPIIAITASVVAEEIERFRAAGADGVLNKPFTQRQLVDKLTEVLDQKGIRKGAFSRESLRSANHPTSGNGQSVNEDEWHFSIDQLKDLSQGDDEFVRNMLEEFLKSSRSCMERLKRDLDKRDLESVADCAHEIIPACRHLDAGAAVEPLMKIESKSRNGSDVAEIERLVDRSEQAMEQLWEQIECYLKR